MRIKKLHLQNFRCYESLDIDFESGLTVIVGENGKGKTAIFDALAIAMEPYLAAFGVVGKQISQKDVRRIPIYMEDGKHIKSMQSLYPVHISMEVCTSDGKSLVSERTLDENSNFIENSGDLAAYGAEKNKSVAAGEPVVLPVLAYYGTSRIWIDSHINLYGTKALEERGAGYEECLEPSSSFHTFGRWFEQITKCADKSEYPELEERFCVIKDAIQMAINACMKSTGLRDIYFNHNLECFVVSHPDTGEMIVSDLSDGFRSIISMVADLAYRMVRLNPHLDAETALKTPGIVLIDEIDMHLHPIWQQTIMGDLRSAFPKVQFIITTHSPQVLSSVRSETVRVLRWGKHFEGVGRVNFSLGAESYQLLKSIQNVDPRPSTLPIVRKLYQYLGLVSQDKWDTDEAKELRKELDEWAKGNEPALLRADMDIRMRAFRRKRP